MNFCVETDKGLCEIDPRSAHGCAVALGGRIHRVEEREQPGMLRAIHELELAAEPTLHLDVERFTPPWYVPGWTPDP